MQQLRGAGGQGLIAPEQSGFFVESISVVADEDRGNAKGAGSADLSKENWRSRIPCGISACLEGGAHSSRREAGGVWFGLDQLGSREPLDGVTGAIQREEGVVLLSGGSGLRLEPVAVVGDAVFHRPLFHGMCEGVGHFDIELLAGLSGGHEALEDIVRQLLLHLLQAEGVHAEVIGNLQEVSVVVRGECHLPGVACGHGLKGLKAG